MARVRITGHADYNPHANYSGQVSDGSLDRDPKISTKMKPVDESEAIAGVYMYINKINSKVYIGSSKDIITRHKYHIKGKGSKCLYNAFKKYGLENFEFEIIYKYINYNDITDRENLYKIEQDYLDKYEFKLTYNINPCTKGATNVKRTEKQKNHIKEFWKLNGHPCLGRKVSEETREKISKKAKKRLSDPTKNPNYGVKQTKEKTKKTQETWKNNGHTYNFYKIDKNLNIEGPFIILKKYCRENNLISRGINLCFSEKCRTYKGFAWCKEADLEKRINQIKSEPKFFDGKKLKIKIL